jgi:hypothetical protein
MVINLTPSPYGAPSHYSLSRGQSNFVRSATPSGNLEGVPSSPLHGNATAAEAVHPSPMSAEQQLQAKELYIDRLLDDNRTAERRRAESSVIKVWSSHIL